jgi:drug/metabolite transporter (DMT)-like permease
MLAGFLYGDNWGTGLALGVFILATYALVAMTPKPEAPPATARQLGFPGWSLVSYCVIIGLGFNWACVFLWFSRQYAFFSAPVIGATGLIMAFCAAIAFLVARLTRGNWLTALLVFVSASVFPAAIVLRLGLVR